MSFLGIDLGTTFIKGAVLNIKARSLDHLRRTRFPDRLDKTSPYFWEFDPQQIVAAVQSLLDELALHAPKPEGIVMSSQMHGVVLVNDRGDAVSNCVSWRDQRALMPHPSGRGTYFEEIARRLTPHQQKQLGHELQPERPLCVLFWLAEQGKLKQALAPVSMPDFVLCQLCKIAPGVEATHAGAYGAFNLETFDWHQEVIKELGLECLTWPPIRKQGDVVGSLKVGKHSAPSYAPMGDYQCALAGALLGTEELSMNISTGAQVSRLTTQLTLGEFQTRPFFDGEFLNTFTHMPGGRSLNVFVDLLSGLAAARGTDLRDPWEFIARVVREIKETDLKVDLNLFPGPNGNPGMISNIRGDNFTAGHLFRAAFNDMADKYFQCALRLWPERSWKDIVFSGGVATGLEPLRETIQKKFGTPYRLAPVTEDTLFGLLILARVFSGRSPSVKAAIQELRS